MHNFPRPQTSTVKAEREDVAGKCTECGSDALQAYRVLSEGGWWNVIKCQDCLASLKREPGPLLGAITPLGAEIV